MIVCWNNILYFLNSFYIFPIKTLASTFLENELYTIIFDYYNK